jgi:ribosomal protein L11 methyltransferase
MPYHQYTIFISDRFKDPLIRRLSEVGSLGVIEDDNGVIAYFPDTVSAQAIENEIQLIKTLLEKSGQGSRLTFEYSVLPDADWNESWKKGFTPLDVGETFTILPPWEERRQGRINLVIDPGMAFGTGHHETTRSCLVLMEKYAPRIKKDRFLDVGTGTGLLAIAAAKLGFKKVLGVDTDPLAIEAAKMNCELNDAGAMVVREGDISVAKGTHDVIAANLFSGLLIKLTPEIARHLEPGGIAVLAGMLRGQEDEVITAMSKAGLRLLQKLDDGKWTSLAGELM